MKNVKTDLQKILTSHGKKPISIEKIRAEASHRDFFRIRYDKNSEIAMMYPSAAEEEIESVLKFTDIYKKNRLNVPEVLNVLENRIVLIEDLGDISLQKYLLSNRGVDIRKSMVTLNEILLRLRSIERINANSKLNNNRLKLELDFFLENFIKNYFKNFNKNDEITGEFDSLVSGIDKCSVFAHRDFHSRNIFIKSGKFFLIDFQDSLIANKYYDLVSIAFDSYLDLPKRDILFALFAGKIESFDYDQLNLVALQRNLKALGTFGFQIFEKRNLSYRKYIKRTILNILKNPAVNLFPAIKEIIRMDITY